MKERIAGVRPDEIGRPTGAFRVEMLDDRGKVVDRVDSSNYISPTLLAHLRWYQAAAFHRALRFAHLGAATVVFPTTVSRRGLDGAPVLPVEGIAALTSSLPEDTASDRAPGRVVGYATRWKTTIPASGPRGQINEAQSEMTIDGSKIVFDFNENQGNGTFQSMVIGRPVLSNTAPRLWLPAGRSRWMGDFPIGLIAASTRSIAAITATDVYGFDITARVIRRFSLTGTSFNSENYRDLSGLTVAASSSTLASLATTTSATGVGSISTFAQPGLALYSGDYVIAYSDGRGNLNVGRWTNAGVRAWATAVASSGSTSHNPVTSSVAVVGDNAYAVASPSSTSIGAATSIYRIRLSDGVVTATYPLGTKVDGSALQSLGGICTNGTDLFVMTEEGVIRYTITGGYLEAYGDPTVGSQAETGVAPWGTVSNGQGLGHGGWSRDQITIQATPGDRSSGGSGIMSPSVVGAGPFLAWFDGGLWLAPVGSGTAWASLDGGNAFSRTVLPTARTKNTSTTMKWTYEITFPSEWRSFPAHPVPPI